MATLARYLVNQFDGRRAADREVLKELRRLLGPRVLPQVIQEDVSVRLGGFIGDSAPGSQVVADLAAVCEELLPRRAP